MHAPEPAVIAASRWEYIVENSSWRQGSESGTEETWSVDRANWNGEEMVCCGERIRVDKGVNVRDFLTVTLL